MHLLYFLKFPNYWNFEKDSFGMPVVKEDIIKLATQLACRLFPSDVRNPDSLELDSQGDILICTANTDGFVLKGFGFLI